MPHIRIRSMTEKQVQALSTQLPQALAPIMQTEEDNFTIERISTQFFKNGKTENADPFIEVLWFDRGQTVQNQSAEKITALIQELADFAYIQVVFTALTKSAYYENAKHF